MKKPRAGSFKGAKTERDRGQGSNHGGKYEAHKGASDINVQANGPAGAPKRCGIKKEDAGLESHDFEDESGVAQHIGANLVEHPRQLSEWPPMLDGCGNEIAPGPPQQQQCHSQGRDDDSEGDEQRPPGGIQIAAMPKQDESERADHEIGRVIR